MRRIIEKLLHMIRTKDCRHVCLFCEYYDICRSEAREQEDKEK